MFRYPHLKKNFKRLQIMNTCLNLNPLVKFAVYIQYIKEYNTKIMQKMLQQMACPAIIVAIRYSHTKSFLSQMTIYQRATSLYYYQSSSPSRTNIPLVPFAYFKFNILKLNLLAGEIFCACNEATTVLPQNFSLLQYNISIDMAHRLSVHS